MKVYRIWDTKFNCFYKSTRSIWLKKNHATCAITYALKYKRFSEGRLVIKEFELKEITENESN